MLKQTGVLLFVLALFLLAGCNELREQPKYDKPFEESPLFGSAARPLVPNTVARGFVQDDELFFAGTVDGELVDTFPFAVTAEVLERGQEQYDIFCAPCHGVLGDGQGVVVLRGFPSPSSFHTERLRQAPAGYFFTVITEGSGVMLSYASRVPVEERWAIVAYIRALQLSQHATLDDVPPAARPELLTEGRGDE